MDIVPPATTTRRCVCIGVVNSGANSTGEGAGESAGRATACEHGGTQRRASSLDLETLDLSLRLSPSCVRPPTPSLPSSVCVLASEHRRCHTTPLAGPAPPPCGFPRGSHPLAPLGSSLHSGKPALAVQIREGPRTGRSSRARKCPTPRALAPLVPFPDRRGSLSPQTGKT